MSTKPVVATADPELAHELTRHCAAAGVTPQVCRSYDELAQRWRQGGVVLLGADLAQEVAAAALPRHGQAHLILASAADPGQLRLAVTCGVEQIFELPGDAQRLGILLGDLADDQGGHGVVVGVTAGAGGAGASTFAAAVAQTAGRRGQALLVDLDPYGPGSGTVMGLSEAGEVGWEALASRGGRMAGRALRDSLPRSHGTSVLGWKSHPEQPAEGTVREALDAGARGYPLVVVDLPRYELVPAETGAHLDLVIVLTRPDVTGLASAARSVGRWGAHRCGVVIRGPRPRAELVESVAGAPVLARMRDQRGLGESVDLGFGPLRRPRGPLHDAVLTVLDALTAQAAA